MGLPGRAARYRERVSGATAVRRLVPAKERLMSHVEPLVPFPSQISRAELVRAGPEQQLWRASFRGERVALRLARLEEPLFSPPEIISRAANLASELRLANTAELI